MIELHLPLDFERLRPFRLMVAQLTQLQLSGAQLSPQVAGMTATFLWARLWVELGLLVQTTNQPGRLSLQDAELFKPTVNGVFGDNCDPLAEMVKAEWLQAEEGGYRCAMFAEYNAHLAGNFMTKEEKGNVRSALVRQGKRLAIEAVAQGMLLPVEMFERPDGTRMNDTEQNRCMVLVKNLDNALGLPGRKNADFTQGLINDAFAVVAEHDADQLRQFYFWVAEHRGKPTVPRSTEGLLREFKTYHAASLAGDNS
jgi:hypothetical protein